MLSILAGEVWIPAFAGTTGCVKGCPYPWRGGVYRKVKNRPLINLQAGLPVEYPAYE
ncbi:hypothetical protein [Janthinobacterium sp. HH01]|uniref:hypothetical protein n=1 Tax=Janthinobacterium sp. HH01 TaxID=1198452 RepID=UPI00178C378D|nr:hypothetical protein [Janthinobacterium sp. HH01]